jgi:hypothetical protein
MDFLKPLLCFVLLLGWVASSCCGPTRQPQDRHTPQSVGLPIAPASAQPSPTSADSIDALRKSVAADRKAVELGELQLTQLRSLAKAGRVSDPEMLAAELEVLKLRQKLQISERELEDAQHGAAADERPQAGARG